MSERNGYDGRGFKNKVNLTLAALGVVGAATVGAKAVESKGGIEEVIKDIHSERIDNISDKIARESNLNTYKLKPGEGPSAVFAKSGWNDGSLADSEEYFEVIRSLEQNNHIDFNNLQPNQEVTYYKRVGEVHE